MDVFDETQETTMTSVHTGPRYIGEAKQRTLSRVCNILIDQDLLAVCGFAAVGLLLTICLARVFPIADIVNAIGQID